MENKAVKLCTKCNLQEKEPYHSYCRSCKNESVRIHYAANKEQYKLRGQRYRKSHAAYLSVKNTAWNKAHPELSSVYQRNSAWRKFAILNEDGTQFTCVDYDRQYQVQQGRCRVCGLHQSELARRLCADHNHTTGKFRGLLCDLCNKALGQARDSSAILRQLADYLEGGK